MIIDATSRAGIIPQPGASPTAELIGSEQIAEIGAAFTYTQENGGPRGDPVLTTGQGFLNRLIDRDPALAEALLHPDRGFGDYAQSFAANAKPSVRASAQARLVTELAQIRP